MEKKRKEQKEGRNKSKRKKGMGEKTKEEWNTERNINIHNILSSMLT
jgi:hypothetical protein